jgi:glutathione synthase/RimK-type ligase-like ATP-grasp enzyme
MKQCAFLTLDERGDFVIDDEHAVGPLAALGWQVSTVSWRQTATPWSRFDAVVVRSTWDYWNDVPAFLDALARINRQTRLANPLDLVHWNLAKTYLRDLQGNGVGVVPTAWLDELPPGAMRTCAEQLGSDDLVIKPVVGANGQDAFRLSPRDDPQRLRDIADRFRGRACMVQPFRANVLTEGEYSLFFFSGEYSHAILKVPAAGEFRSQEERGAEIRSIAPEAQLLARGRQALAAVEPTPLYARIDFVRDTAGDFEVMELELIEPSLYLRTEPEAPARFARAVDRWFAAV